MSGLTDRELAYQHAQVALADARATVDTLSALLETMPTPARAERILPATIKLFKAARELFKQNIAMARYPDERE